MLGHNFFRQKKMLVGKKLGRERFLWEIFFGRKKFLVFKRFWVKKFQKKLLAEIFSMHLEMGLEGKVACGGYVLVVLAAM